MTKALRKAIMVRSKLKNKYNKNRTGKNWKSYKKQRNLCVSLLRKTKKDYFNDLNIKNITDSKAFWKTIKLYFSNKSLNSSSLILSQKNKVVINDQDIANIMKNYFTGITNHLNLKPDQIDGRYQAMHPPTPTSTQHQSPPPFTTHPEHFPTHSHRLKIMLHPPPLTQPTQNNFPTPSTHPK